MNRTESVRHIVTGRNKILYLLLAAIIALMAFAVGAFASDAPIAANAESAGTVTVHVYDPNMKYGELGGWFWIKGGATGIHGVIKSPTSDEKFFKEYDDNGSQVKNAAYTFTLDFTAAEIASLKSGVQFGMLICKVKGTTGGFDDRYIKETADVLLDLSSAFDANNHADIYYVRKDATAYIVLEEALKTLEKIISATFTAKTAKTATVSFEASMPIAKTSKATLLIGETAVATAGVTVDSQNPCKATVRFTVAFDFSKEYSIEVAGIPTGCGVNKTALIDDADFIKTFESAETQNLKYGAIYSATSTTFRVWAPLASAVKLNIYESGIFGTPVKNRYAMKQMMTQSGSWGGVWEYTLDGDQNGKYYTYSVNNSGVETETIDPYAKACGTDGLRGMVVDLSSTNPKGWKEDAKWRDRNADNKKAVDTPIIWEVSVNDFSSSADSGMKYKGKYLAFTEKDTTVPGKPGLKTGVNYLKDLGVTYVHLNPVYDFATVDEGDLTRADGGSYNWGYDPQNYNIPEGSYSTDPANGAVRINEFKRMVMALHDAGIGVVMDVVYNHTYSTSGQALHDTVPYYYHRTDENGKFTNGSGCSNETASERTMMRKYMVDSMKYWAEEYHIDGFRFDLMGIHDNTTITTIRKELDKLDRRILLYGEPWAADGSYIPRSFTNRMAASKSGVTGYATNPSTNMLIKNMFAGYNNDYPRDMTKLPDRVAVFNDTCREGLRGNNDPGRGWVNCEFGDGKVGKVMRTLEGGAGGSGNGMALGVGSRNVAYAAAHDNYTLWDQIRGAKHGDESALFYDDPVADDVKRCKLVASVYMMSPGMSFILAGDEMGRTKYGNEDSYNSPPKLNQIVWSRQADFADLHDYFKRLIALRRQYSPQLFSYSKSTDASYCWGNFGGNEDNVTGKITFTRTQNGATLALTLEPSKVTQGGVCGTVRIGNTTLTIR